MPDNQKPKEPDPQKQEYGPNWVHQPGSGPVNPESVKPGFGWSTHAPENQSPGQTLDDVRNDPEKLAREDRPARLAELAAADELDRRSKELHRRALQDTTDQSQYAAFLQRAAGQGVDLEPLTSTAAAVYEILLDLPPHRGMTGAEIISELWSKKQLNIQQSALTNRIIPELRPYGVENFPRKGYRITPGRRPTGKT